MRIESYVFQFSEDQKSVSCTHEWCAPEIKPTIERIQNAPLDAFPWAMKKFLSAEMVLIPRVSDLPHEAAKEKQEFERQGIQIDFGGADDFRRPDHGVYRTGFGQ